VTRIINDLNDKTDSVTLNPTISGGSGQYTYKWMPQDPTVRGSHCSSLSVQPTETTIYSVTVTDSSASVTASVKVKVVGSLCKTNFFKVIICHFPPGNPEHGISICVSENAVSAHLAHGDERGFCDDPSCPVQQQTITPICPEK
jgi:hypothetical protein